MKNSEEAFEMGKKGVVPQFYQETANELVNRILALIPENPSILAMENPWKLFKIEGFKCDDLEPSLFQATLALAKAKQVYKNNEQK